MFGGTTFDAKRDGSRLNAQLEEVRQFMLTHADDWWSLEELEVALGYPQASISARLRDLRKAKFGGYEIARAYVARGQWAYKFAGRKLL